LIDGKRFIFVPAEFRRVLLKKALVRLQDIAQGHRPVRMTSPTTTQSSRSASSTCRDQMLRVYWLTEAFYPPIVGGQELFASQIVQALALKGVNPSVITRQTGSSFSFRRTPGAGEGAQGLPQPGILRAKAGGQYCQYWGT